MATVNIVDGSSKFDIMIALFNTPKNGQSEDLLDFTLADGEVVRVMLRGVQMEDGSHEYWLLTGRTVSGSGYEDFEAYYSTKTRNGYMLTAGD